MCAAVKINRLGKFDLNPRGNLWLKDENRFGHKLLSRMGWSQGKGLGKDENGIAENLKVKMKSGNSGVGWSDKMPLATENDEYDAVLANLNEKFKCPENKTKPEEDLKSMEIRSQQFKNRLHYGKFVRGKDVCRYSEKDMNSIFVMKKPKSEPSPAHVKSSVTNIDSPTSEDESSETVPIFKSQLSMKEYFEMKMKNKSGVQNSVDSIKVENVEESSEKKVALSRKKSKNKKLKLDPEILENSSSNGTFSQDHITETEEPSAEKDVSIRKKNKTKSSEKSKIVKLEPGISEESSSEGEMPKHSMNTIKTENLEISSSKKETLSRKRSMTTESTEKSKRLKFDPELVEELSTSNVILATRSDDMMEASPCKSKFPQTSFCTVTIEDEEPREVSKKRKRKKDEKRKKVKPEVVDISEESISPESSEKELPSDMGENPVSEVQVSDKKRKKLAAKMSKKTKSSKLAKLKTCLKGSVNYSLERESRRVSFNEKVLYRVFNSDDEDVDTEPEPTNESETRKSIASSGDETLDMPVIETEVYADGTSFGFSDLEIELCNGESSHYSDAQKTEEPCSVEAESDDVPDCMNLPKCNTSNYNSWLENQRIASKMKLYQNVIKKIKKHPVLKTSNMLNLKGYGNWGF